MAMSNGQRGAYRIHRPSKAPQSAKGDLVVLFKTKNGAKLSYCYKANYTANTFLRKNSNNTYN